MKKLKLLVVVILIVATGILTWNILSRKSVNNVPEKAKLVLNNQSIEVSVCR